MKNNITDILSVFIVVMFIGGFVAGIVLGNYFSIPVVTGAFTPRISEVFNTGIMILTWVSTLIIGMLFVSLTSIIKLLQKSITTINSLSNEQELNDVS